MRDRRARTLGLGPSSERTCNWWRLLACRSAYSELPSARGIGTPNERARARLEAISQNIRKVRLRYGGSASRPYRLGASGQSPGYGMSPNIAVMSASHSRSKMSPRPPGTLTRSSSGATERLNP